MCEVEVAAEKPADVIEGDSDVVDRSRRPRGDVDRAPTEAGQRDAGGIDQIVGNGPVPYGIRLIVSVT